jgi:hypothetical protein
MTQDLTPYTAPVGGSTVRRAGRAVSRYQSNAVVRVASSDAATDVAIGKVENLTMATGTAMQAVIRVAKAQRQLEQLAPEAAGRLAYLADDHLLGCGEVLTDLRCNLRRR